MMARQTLTLRHAVGVHLHKHQPVLELEWAQLLKLTNGHMPWKPAEGKAELEQRIWELQQELDELEDELRSIQRSFTPDVQEQVRILMALHDQWGIAWPTELEKLATFLPENQAAEAD